jgi:2'-5' RNA ligase
MRLFIALPIPDAVADELGVLQEGVAAADWTEPDDLHLTLRFVGDWPEHLLQPLVHALGRLRQPSFTLGLRGVGFFPPRSQPQFLWAGVSQEAELLRLQARVDALVAEVGGGRDPRQFSPHVTLGRLRNRPGKLADTSEVAGWLAQWSSWSGPAWEADRVVLYQSGTTSGGGGYLPLYTFWLGERG